MGGRQVIVVLAIVTMAFSGCVSEGTATEDKGGARVKSAKGASGLAKDAFVATLPDGTLVDPSLLLDVPALKGLQRNLPDSSLEPTLGVTSKGTVFMSSARLNGGINNLPSSKVFASFDQGGTWMDVTPTLPGGAVKNPPYTGDPYVYVDPVTSRVFSVDLQLLYCSWTSVSDNEGASWTTSPVGCGQPIAPQDHQTIVAGKARVTPVTAYQNRMVYYCVNRVGDSSCASSIDGGLTYGPLIPVMLGWDVEASRLCGGLHGHVRTDNAGRVFLPKAQCGLPTVAVSEDDGKTWKVHRISNVPTRKGSPGDIGDHEVRIAADASDNLYAIWIGENGLPHLSISRDHGQKWSPARVVSPPGVTATDKPAIYATAEGKVAFVYIGSTVENGYAKKPQGCQGQEPDCMRRAWADATWNAYVGVMTDALAENAIVLTTTANDPADPIAVGQCGGTRCSGLYDFIDIVIDPQGRPWAALVDVCGEKCLADWENDPVSARPDMNFGFVGTLAAGPALTKEGGALPPLPYLVEAATASP